MKVDIETLQDWFKIGYDIYSDSRKEADRVLNYYHNRQYTEKDLTQMANRGQPPETFNVIKLFGRLVLGYYSTVVNAFKVYPVQMNDILTSALLNDVANLVMRDNQMETEMDKTKLDALLQGIMCCYLEVQDTGNKDKFGRPIYRVAVSHVPVEEIILDPLSRLEDYSDARFIHRWKWISEEYLRKTYGVGDEGIKKLNAYDNHLDIDQAEFESRYADKFVGKYKIMDNYLVVHSIVVDDKNRVWSVHWSGDTILEKKEVTHREMRFPYRVVKIHTSNIAEYYGIFREILESQRAINQAIVKIQLMVNSQKVFVEKGAVENIAAFSDMLNRVNAVIPVNKLSGVRVENISSEIADQYTIIDRALDRIQRILGVNDSFLGMAYASDSGRKVKLQQNATAMSLRYVSTRIEQFYRLLGKDICNLVKQYYTANQVFAIMDESVGLRWIELNKPLEVWNGAYNPDGSPKLDYVYQEVLNPENREPIKDEDGRYVIAPISDADTEISFTSYDIYVDSVAYNDEDEKNQLMLETFLQGNIGTVLSQVNPAGYFKAAALSIKNMKSRHSLDISAILEDTANMVATGAMAMPTPENMPTGADQKGSMSLKLPQNTNEGL